MTSINWNWILGGINVTLGHVDVCRVNILASVFCRLNLVCTTSRQINIEIEYHTVSPSHFPSTQTCSSRASSTPLPSSASRRLTKKNRIARVKQELYLFIWQRFIFQQRKLNKIQLMQNLWSISSISPSLMLAPPVARSTKTESS